METLFSRLGASEDFFLASRFLEEELGARLSRQAQAASFKRGRLLIRVKAPAYRHEISMMRHKLQDRLNQRFGKKAVEEISVSSV